MSKINKHNYEAYLLDFMEGTLSKEDAKALEKFLKENPQIDADIFDSSGLSIKPDEQVNFNNKLQLQRDESLPEFSKRDSLLIGLLEDNLNTTDREKAKKLLAENESALRDYTLYKKTKLEADYSVTYKGKSSLKKKAPVLSLRQVSYASVAAVLVGLLAFALIRLNTPGNTLYQPGQIAKTSDVIHFDAEKTNKPETNLQTAIQQSEKPEHLASNTNRHNSGEKESRHTENTITEKTQVNTIPRMGVKELPYDEQRMSDVVMNYREISEPVSPLNINNITYVKVSQDKKGIQLPNRKEIDETLEKYNPIKNLREAKNELLATNAKSLFNRE